MHEFVACGCGSARLCCIRRSHQVLRCLGGGAHNYEWGRAYCLYGWVMHMCLHVRMMHCEYASSGLCNRVSISACVNSKSNDMPKRASITLSYV